ncbi:hypothetical protein BaRGS_00038821 [Batillaria attramentaria]|uniref:Uncharacterized protein n=1 Tax=Batillaria attramentaria TaxID=370345 RepID=A0ABD0J4X4_9CAEN
MTEQTIACLGARLMITEYGARTVRSQVAECRVRPGLITGGMLPPKLDDRKADDRQIAVKKEQQQKKCLQQAIDGNVSTPVRPSGVDT